MATLADYTDALNRATQAGDDEAVAHFQSEIDKVTTAPTDAKNKPVPQGGSILNPVGQGLTFGFLDELAGIGGGLASAGRGALGLTPEGQEDSFSRGYNEIAGDIRQADKEYAERHPYVSTAAEIGSGLALPLGMIKSGASGLRTALSSGAAYGTGKAEGGVGERAKGAVTGAATGAAGHGVVRALSGLGRAVFPEVASKAKGPAFQEAVQTLRSSGIPVSAAEKIGSKEGRMAERMTASYFGMPNKMEARPEQLYGRLMKYSGFEAADSAIGELSEEAINRASQRFNKRYDNVLKNITVQLPDMDPWLRRIEAGVAQLLPHEIQGATRTADRIIKSFRAEIGRGRTLSGTDYKRLRSDLGKRARASEKQQVANWTAPIYKALQANLDDAFRQGVPKARADALKRVDADYSGYKVLQEAGKNPEAIGTMVNKVRNGQRPRKEFQRLAKAYQDVLLRGYKQTSGTAENTVAKSMIPPVASMIRATGAKGSALMHDIGGHIPQGVKDATQGAVPFIAGQQAPDSDLEELVKMLGGLR